LTLAESQEQELISILLQNEKIVLVLKSALKLNLPNWYLGAGAIAQTFWNYKSGLSLDHGIEDYDLVFFSKDMSDKQQAALLLEVPELFDGISVDIVNEATVHNWYYRHFKKEIKPYISTESAIDTWPTTATCIGVRMTFEGLIEIYAPFGLSDLFSLTVRANKVLISEDVYYNKVKKWRKNWDCLNIIEW
jgi:hypothetical protein